MDRLRTALTRLENPSKWAIRFGLVDPGVDELLFDAVIHEFLTLDVPTYNMYTTAVANHDASDILQTLPFPVLTIAGERDRFIRSDRMEEMSAVIPTSEHFEVKGATHYLPLEYGTLFGLKTDDFIIRQKRDSKAP